MRATRESSRYSVPWAELRQARERSRVPLKAFASECGWSVTYQSLLERGHYKTVQGDTVELLSRALRKLCSESLLFD